MAVGGQYRRKSEEYEKLAYFDVLTGLPNRRKTFEYLLNCAKQYENAKKDFFVLYMDLNDFKSVNDRFGHNVGDQLLFVAAQRMNQCLHGGLRFLGRLGGDEFLIVGFPQNNSETTQTYMQWLNNAFSSEFIFDDIHIQCGISVGYALYSAYKNIDRMIYQADERMYLMKNSAAGDKAPRLKGRSYERR